MRTMVMLSAAALAGIAVPVAASRFFTVTKTCPVGGERFAFAELASITTFSAFPDGMPIGSGTFPIAMPVCPDNGLVMYRAFDAATVKRLRPIIASAAYQSARRTETPYYLAYRIETELGGGDALPGLLLSATWEAKNGAAIEPRATRYNEEFVALVGAMPVDAASFASIAYRARAANALRELGKFAEAEALRRSIAIAPGAGGTDDEAVENRGAWAEYLAALAAPIARGDAGRAPIDLLERGEAASRCIAPEAPADPGAPPVPPLTAFETSYCAAPELAEYINEQREMRGDWRKINR